jgi:replicative DNA helicase
MARNVALDHNVPVAFFSLEMSATQLMMRLIVAESQLDTKSVKTGRLTPEQWRHLEESIKPFQTAPMYIDDTPALSVFEFRSKARRLKMQHDIQLIVIDYLQLMTGSQDSRGNREQEVAGISRTLKAIAKELNIPIIALSQLNRASELRGGSKKPQLSDLRESGAIEQDADIVAFIHRPEYFGMKVDEDNIPLPPGLAEFIIAKHRNGATETVRLKFRKEQARFLDYDSDDYDMSESSMNGGSGGGRGGDITGYDGPGGYTESYTPPRRPSRDDDAPF